MIKVALYARYSSENQRDASIKDQLRLCRLHAEKQGWTIVDRLYRPRHLRRFAAAPGHSGVDPGRDARPVCDRVCRGPWTASAGTRRISPAFLSAWPFPA